MRRRHFAAELESVSRIRPPAWQKDVQTITLIRIREPHISGKFKIDRRESVSIQCRGGHGKIKKPN